MAAVVLAALALLPPVSVALGQDFYIDLFTRIMIFAIAAMSLDLILGYGGMVSFGHAAYLGIGSYAVGILSYYGCTNGFLHFGVAILASALVALFIGWAVFKKIGSSFGEASGIGAKLVLLAMAAGLVASIATIVKPDRGA